GFVTRMPSLGWDRRQVKVELTRKARNVLKWVNKFLIEPGYMWLAVYAIFGMRGDDVGTLYSLLESVRTSFDDNATFLWPWFHPAKWRRRVLSVRPRVP